MSNLPEPEHLENSEFAIEMARIWLVDKRPTFVISRQVWGNPGLWGALVSDLIDHVANIYEDGGMERKQVLRMIEAEYESRRGGLQEK